MMRLLRLNKELLFLFSRGKQFRTMSSTSTTHLERTGLSSRDRSIFSAEVIKINQLSKSVKELKLKIFETSFSFKSGQWVDFFIPELATVGGFSISSSPKELQFNNQLSLAIKYSKHPPAHWVHTQCKAGDKVQIRVGGDFYLEQPKSNCDKEDILLIAGGVGINPLWSMMQCVADAIKEYEDPSHGRTSLLYSACSNDELLFKDSIIVLCNCHPLLMDCKFYVSTDKTTDKNQATYDNWTQGGRISKEALKISLSRLDKNNIKVFICGPQPMIHSMMDSLVELGVDINKIHFEKWW